MLLSENNSLREQRGIEVLRTRRESTTSYDTTQQVEIIHFLKTENLGSYLLSHFQAEHR